jgi:uncharacterized membrane protein YfcA
MILPAPGHDILIVFVAVFVGAVVQGSVGFGSALIAAPVMALVDSRMVPGTALCLGLCLSLAMARRERAALELGRMTWALIGRVPGILAGVAALQVLTLSGLRQTFAALVLAGVALSVVGASVTVRPLSLLLAGALSGLMGTIASIGGPPMALLHQAEAGATLRANLSFYFAVGTALSLVAVAAIGRFGRHEIAWTVLLLPAVVLGFAVSGRAARRLDRGRTKPAVLLVSTVAAILVLGRELLEL